jgi:hypothetical protein
MRRLVATLVVGMALVGAIYIGSLRLGSRFYEVGCGLCVGPSTTDGRVLRARADWQAPISILIGVLGVAGGLVVHCEPLLYVKVTRAPVCLGVRSEPKQT